MGVATHILPSRLLCASPYQFPCSSQQCRSNTLLFEVKLWGKLIAQESKTATPCGWLSWHSLSSSALDESGTVQLPSHFRIQTIDRSSRLLDYRELGNNHVPEVTAIPGVPPVASVPAFK